MPRPVEKHPGPDAFLCEACGYDLTGLGLEGACPECGTPAERSDPARRVGTPAQLGGGIGAILRTDLLMLRSRSAWDRVRIVPRRRAAPFLVNCTIAAAIIGAMLLAPGPLTPGGARRSYAIAFAGNAFILLIVLTLIEHAGVRFFGRQRRWRVSRAVADAVCVHASVGWIIAALLFGVGWHAGQRLTLEPLLVLPEPLFGGIALTWAAILPIAGFLLGLLAFEILVYLGVRRLRFANHPGVRAEAPVPHPPARRPVA